MRSTRFTLRTFVAAAVFASIAIVSTRASAEQPPPEDVLRAARSGIKAFLSSGEPQSVRLLGFTDRAEIDAATLGDAFPIYTVPPDRLLQRGSAPDLRALAVPTTLWQVIVVSRGTARSLLTIDRVNGSWTPVSIGSAGLASQLMTLIDTWPASAGYQYRLIRVYQATSDLMEVSQDGVPLGFVPFESARLAMRLSQASFDPRDLRTSSEVTGILRPLVAKALQSQR